MAALLECFICQHPFSASPSTSKDADDSGRADPRPIRATVSESIEQDDEGNTFEDQESVRFVLTGNSDQARLFDSFFEYPN